MNESHGLLPIHELGKVGFAEFVYVIEFAVGKKPGAADTGEDLTG
jgi:hypothetical protein